ncbi:MAG: FHA domain-containing protein [Chloroflexota bacterium]|jgi:predicted component of type VI protein secretion system
MAQFQFVMRSGPTPGVTFPLDGDQLTIGRDSSNGVAINDAEVSRKHSRLSFQGGKYVIEDLGSTNGTFVNGQRLAGPVVLKAGDVVSLGEQIVLMYDAINMDAGATVAVSRKSARVEPPPMQPAAPVYASNPAPAYAPPPAAGKKSNMVPIVIGGGVFLFICLCVVTFLIIDADPTGARWCMFPFSIIAQLMGSVCP